MVRTAVLNSIPEDIKDNIAKYIVFHNTVYYESEQYKNSLIMSLDKVYFVLIGYEHITNQLSVSEAEKLYSQICNLIKFYQFIQSQLITLKSKTINEISTMIQEISKLLKKLQVKIRNIIEHDIKNAISQNNNESMMSFLTKEHQNL